MKLKWFKRRLVFNQPSAEHEHDNDDNEFGLGASAAASYRELAAAEPQLLRAVFRTGRDCDDYVDVPAVAPPLPRELPVEVFGLSGWHTDVNVSIHFSHSCPPQGAHQSNAVFRSAIVDSGCRGYGNH